MSNVAVYKSLTDGHTTWQIIKKNGVYHWRGDLERCEWCGKLSFEYEDVAWLYSEYLNLKYGKEQTPYYDCDVWHLTTDFHVWW